MSLPPELLIEQLSFLSPSELCRLNLSKELQHIQKKFIVKALLKRFDSEKTREPLEHTIFDTFRLHVLHLATKQHVREYFLYINDTIVPSFIILSKNKDSIKKFLSKNCISKLLNNISYDDLIRDIMIGVYYDDTPRHEWLEDWDDIAEYNRTKFPSKRSVIDHINERMKKGKKPHWGVWIYNNEIFKLLSKKCLDKAIDKFLNYINKKNKKIPFEYLGISKNKYKLLLEKLTKKELCLIIKNLRKYE